MFGIQMDKAAEKLKHENILAMFFSSPYRIILTIYNSEKEGTLLLLNLSKEVNLCFENSFPRLFKQQCVNTGNISQNCGKVYTKRQK
jgi:hypothetical protein